MSKIPDKKKITHITLTATPEIDFGDGEGDGKSKKLPTFTMVAYTGDLVTVYGTRMIVDLQGMSIPKQKIPIRFQHDPDKGVGHTTAVRIEKNNIICEGIISRETEFARDITTSSQNGFPWQASIGFSVLESQYFDSKESATINSRTFKGPGYVLRKTLLKETSFVDLGANDKTSATVRLSDTDDPNNFKEFTMSETTNVTNSENTEPKSEFQLSEDKTKTEPVKTEPEKTEPSKVSLSSPSPSPSSFSADQQLQENRRVSAIIHLGAGRLPELEAQAIGDGWTVEKFKGELNAKLMPKGNTINMSTDKDKSVTTEVLEVLALRCAGLSVSEKQYEAKTLELSDKYTGIGIQEFCQLADSSISFPKYLREPQEWLKFAFSSLSLPKILANTANRILLESFNNIDETWKKIVKFGSVNNFFKHERYRMTSNFLFEKLAPDGEIKHGKLGEEKFEQSIETFAKMFSLTRRDIINDDLGAFTDIPKNIGMGAALAINDLVWKTFLSGSTIDGKTFFHVDHKNILANTALNVDGLTKAEEYFITQEQPKVDKKDPSRPLGIMPKYIIVPTSLKVTAEVLMKSIVLDGVTQLSGNINPHSGKFDILSSPYLQSSNYEGSSNKNWYLLADPNRLAGFEIAFLSGKQNPTIESAEADFNTLGIQFRGFIDFGVSAQDSRSGLKLTPPA
jgi:hypothetical protein